MLRYSTEHAVLMPAEDRPVFVAAYEARKTELSEMTVEEFISDVFTRLYIEICSHGDSSRLKVDPHAKEAYEQWKKDENFCALRRLGKVDAATAEQVSAAVVMAIAERTAQLFAEWGGRAWPRLSYERRPEEQEDRRNLRHTLIDYIPEHLGGTKKENDRF